jgi:peptide-methionine (S)-S-oxide reductase
MKNTFSTRFLNIIGISLIFVLLTSFNVYTKTNPGKTEVATFGGGCFWSMEALFQRLNGVSEVQPGFAGGFAKNPSYEEVCTGKTGHAESIQVTYDPEKISYEKIMDVFFKVHDPTTLNRQGADEGSQYRSIVFYHNKKQKEIAEKAKAEILKSGVWGNSPIVTEITPFTNFYKAESYHKNYYNNHSSEGYCVAVIEPKLSKLKAHFRNLLK